MWGAVGAGNHLGVLLPASSLQAHLRGRGMQMLMLAASWWAEVLGGDLGEGQKRQPWSSSCNQGLHPGSGPCWLSDLGCIV